MPQFFNKNQRINKEEPNIHIFNVNLTNGYSENHNDEKDRQDRLAFAEEVDRVYKEQV